MKRGFYWKQYTRYFIFYNKRIKFIWSRIGKLSRSYYVFSFDFKTKNISETGVLHTIIYLTQKEFKKLGPIGVAKKIIITRKLFK